MPKKKEAVWMASYLRLASLTLRRCSQSEIRMDGAGPEVVTRCPDMNFAEAVREFMRTIYQLADDLITKPDDEDRPARPHPSAHRSKPVA